MSLKVSENIRLPESKRVDLRNGKLFVSSKKRVTFKVSETLGLATSEDIGQVVRNRLTTSQDVSEGKTV